MVMSNPGEIHEGKPGRTISTISICFILSMLKLYMHLCWFPSCRMAQVMISGSTCGLYYLILVLIAARGIGQL